MRKFLPGFLFAVLLISCATQDEDFRDFEAAPLFGMIYDRNNQPCAGATVTLEDGRSTVTDINGRFAISSLSKDRHTINVTKDGIEPLVFPFDFIARNQALYLQVISFDQLLESAERELEQKQFVRAGEQLERARAIRADDPVFQYLSALYNRALGEPSRAVEILENIIESGIKETAVFILLADIYQYDLSDTAGAVKYLQQYLKMHLNPDVQARLDRLNG